MMDRRAFLKGLAATSTLPLWMRLGSMAAWADAGAPIPTPPRLLLVVCLSGGNDGLNTVVPYTDPAYASLRKHLALRSDEILPLRDGFALNSSLRFMQRMWTQNRLAIVQNVGYLSPIMSHFESVKVWETGSRDGRFATGWLGRYLDATDGSRPGFVRGVAVNGAVPTTITGTRNRAVSFPSLAEFDFRDGQASDASLRRQALQEFAAAAGTATMHGRVAAAQSTMRAAVDVVQKGPDLPPPASSAEAVAQIMAAGLGTEVGFINIPGWDTHTDQRVDHAAKLKQLDDLCLAFFNAAYKLGIGERAAVLTFSEFGRRVPVNAGAGTDHGTATTMLLMGAPVRGGFYGGRPNLTSLEDGNLRHAVDLRSVYASVLQQFFRVSSSELLGGSFPTLPLFV